MTVFGVDKSKGDVVAIVTVNNGEASKVKFLDLDIVQSNPVTGVGGIIEYVVTFPNVTVNAGEQYQACVLPVKTLELICTTGNNSPAARPHMRELSRCNKIIYGHNLGVNFSYFWNQMFQHFLDNCRTMYIA
jgi:hypothetical protein